MGGMKSQKTKGVALITGASSGFGKEFAKLFAADGYDLVITARPGSKIEAVARELRDAYDVEVYDREIDLSKPGSAKDLHAWVTSKKLTVTHLLNNAGIGVYGRFAENPLERENELLELNVVSLSELCHHFIPDMIKNGGGRILNVASIAAFQPGAYYATYFASKAYVLLFSEALALEYAKDNITVTALCPGVSRTNFFARAEMPRTSWILRSYLMDPEYVAEVGYKAMMRGRVIAIPGIRNKVVAKSYRWLPRGVIARLTRELVDKAGKG
jgi:uncharacterized protein